MNVRKALGLSVSAASVAALALTACSTEEVPTQEQAALTTRSTTGEHTVDYDGHSLKIDGRRLYVWSGEFHYWRLPSPDLWRDVLQKMKAAGFNAVSIYFDWGFHSPKQGVYDFSGIRNVDEVLEIAQQVGIYVIARPGPYINAETDAGGFPGWLVTQAGRARTTAPDYLEASKEWLRHIDAILARHQLLDGRGTIILYQIENEYSNGAMDAHYMQALIDQARADGITVPLFHNDVWPAGNWKPGTLGGPEIYAFDGYPQGFDCSHPETWKAAPDFRWTRSISPRTPMFIAEFQGGSFDPWGGPGFDKCQKLTGPDFESVFYKSNIASGATLQNFYMTFGGTSWGWLPDPGVVYSSYDYGSAIRESRQLTTKYDQLKRMGYFVHAVEPLTKTDYGPDLTASNSKIRVRTNVNPDTKTQFVLVAHADTTSTSQDQVTFSLSGSDGTYATVPQAGSLDLHGREAKMLVAGYDLGAQRWVYSTSEIMTHARIGASDVALVYGTTGQEGETVLRYATAPKVTVQAGEVTATWDAERKDLRLNYRHTGLARVRIEGGARPLELLIADTETSAAYWRQDTAAGPVLERGPYLVRDARIVGSTLALFGETRESGELEVWAPPFVGTVLWNGRPIRTARTRTGTLLGHLDGPAPVTLPELTQWRHRYETPERSPDFDDASWIVANRTTTNNPTKPPAGQPVLYADEYGFHHGDVWYRAHFRATGTETGVSLSASTGSQGKYAAWLNGVYLGASGNGARTFAIPAGALRPDADNVLAVLVENMGHNQDWNHNDSHKEPRGLTSASVSRVGGGTPALVWKIQGNLGGEDLADPVRGPLNNGGLFGERAGWSLPGYPDRDWAKTTLPSTEPTPGVSWYRTDFYLNVPHGPETSIGLRITDDPKRKYRLQIFVNGWNIGRYINDVGPQRTFVIPTGLLRTRGSNTLAVASWGDDDGTGGLGQVSLVNLQAEEAREP